MQLIVDRTDNEDTLATASEALQECREMLAKHPDKDADPRDRIMPGVKIKEQALLREIEKLEEEKVYLARRRAAADSRYAMLKEEEEKQMQQEQEQQRQEQQQRRQRRQRQQRR